MGKIPQTFPASYPLNIYSYKLSQDCGCTDPSAVNYSSIATIDDGSCCYTAGCTDPYAINFNVKHVSMMVAVFYQFLDVQIQRQLILTQCQY